MEVILLTLGVMGFGAILVSAYVFMVAARNYVSEDDNQLDPAVRRPAPRKLVARSPENRRSGRPVTFPLMVNGILIEKDRRSLPDRRRATA